MSAERAGVHDFILSLLDPGAASAILDVGCGQGANLLHIGRATAGATGLVGLDASAQSLAAARAAAGDDPRLSFIHHDASTGLPFDDAEFDRVLSVNLLECIPDRQRLLREIHRVLTPDGRVVLAHWDWDSQLIDGEDKGLVRKVVHAFSDWQQAWMADSDAWMGRRLWRTVQESGLFHGAVHPYVLTSTRFEPGTYGYDSIESFRALVRRGMLAPDEYEAFRRAIVALAEADRYFYSITMFVYAGRKR